MGGLFGDLIVGEMVWLIVFFYGVEVFGWVDDVMVWVDLGWFVW